jgi:16S rRNA (guanine1207-N2)-methyltransferase
VVHRHLGADSLARWLAAEGWPTARTGSRMGYRLLEVRPRPAGSEDAELRPSSGDDPPP